MWRSPLPKGILGDSHLAHMIVSSVPSSRDLRRSESVRPAKLNTRSAVALAAGIARNWRGISRNWSAQEIRSCTTNDNNQTSYKVTSTRGRREAYLLSASSVWNKVSGWVTNHLIWGGVEGGSAQRPPEVLRRSRIFFFSYLVAISFPIEFEVWARLCAHFETVTRSKSSELLTYLLVGHVQNLCCFTHWRVDSSALVFSLSSHRHSYIGLVFSSRFIDS